MADDPEYRAKCNAYSREWRKKNPEKVAIITRKSLLKSRFGITIEAYDKMLADQRGVCALCGGPPGGRWQTFHVDHCHETGRIRGLLCHHCNTGLGSLGDSEESLERALRYLRREDNADG